MKENHRTDFIVIGGLGEVGKNMYALRSGDEMVIIDSGTSFPGDDLLGVNLIVNDLDFIKQNESKIKALVITHGHEDHIGGIIYLIKNVNIPAIYAPKHAAGLINLKLEDNNIRYDNLIIYNEDDHIKFKNMDIEFFRVNHSVPDSHGIAVHTLDGTFVTTGDFKFDLTPIGPHANFSKMVALGDKGVDLLISDSTNALSDGFSKSESEVDAVINSVLTKNADSRIIIATFASNVYRVKHIVESAYKHKRKICLLGRSMENNIKISLEEGYIDHPEIFIDKKDVNNYPDKEVLILSTGTQGEPLAALSRIASGTHKQIKLHESDVIVFSSSAIPGNGEAIDRVINKLALQNIKIITSNDLAGVHTSGHANSEELKLMLTLLKPKYFMPFHGEYRMLKRHAKLAESVGIPKDNIFIMENGDSLIIDNHVIKRGPHYKIDDAFVSDDLSAINNAVLKERKLMASDGILVIIASIDLKNRKLLIKPNITTRGFVLVNENTELIKRIERLVDTLIKEELEKANANFTTIKARLISDVLPYITKLTGRKPIILPLLNDIKR